MAQEAFEELVEDFEFLEDWEDRYRHVIDPPPKSRAALRRSGCMRNSTTANSISTGPAMQ